VILKCPNCGTSDRIDGGDLQFEGEEPYCYKQTCECACGAVFTLRFDLSGIDWKNRDDMGATASVETVGTDQGTGGSWCSGCRRPLDLDKLRETGMRCPGCRKALRWGSAEPYPFGGSDPHGL